MAGATLIYNRGKCHSISVHLDKGLERELRSMSHHSVESMFSRGNVHSIVNGKVSHWGDSSILRGLFDSLGLGNSKGYVYPNLNMAINMSPKNTPLYMYDGMYWHKFDDADDRFYPI